MIKQITDKIKLAALLIPVYLAALVIPAYAEPTLVEEGNIVNSGDFSGLSGLNAANTIGWLIGLIFTIVAIIFFFVLVFGGIKWLTSGGDEKKVAAARASITSALVGLAIVFASWAIIRLIEGVFGISIAKFSLRTFYNP